MNELVALDLMRQRAEQAEHAAERPRLLREARQARRRATHAGR